MAGKIRRKEERTGEKSNFSVTCSLLSQYLKEKGSFKMLGLEMAAPRAPLDQQLLKGKVRAPPATMALLPGAYVPEDEERAVEGADYGGGTLKSMDLFPQHAGFGSPINTLSPEDPLEDSNAKKVDRAQLTIFYGGKVLVFDNFPSDKAMDLMQSCSVSAAPPAPSPVAVPASPIPALESSSRPILFASASTIQTPPPAAAASAAPGIVLAKPAEATASDMPIARRNSLHRFLEKRKDRIITKAPYQVHGGSPAPPEEAKPETSQAWLGLGRQDSLPETSSGSSR